MADPVADLINELRYRSYAFNRAHSPEITPTSWKVLLGPDADAWEERYQEERSNDYANAMIKRAKEVPDWERRAREGAREE
jgi:hypothetical protein